DAAALSGNHELAVTDVAVRESTHYPLTVQAAPGAELGLHIEFDGAVFDEASIEALIGRLRRVLVAMAADPGRALSSVDVVDGAEHSRLDEIGNRAVLAQSVAGASVPVLFGNQVVRTPDAVAVVCEGRSMTYRELDEAANRLAHL